MWEARRAVQAAQGLATVEIGGFSLHPPACDARIVHSAASLTQAMACIVNLEHKRYKSGVNQALNNRR